MSILSWSRKACLALVLLGATSACGSSDGPSASPAANFDLAYSDWEPGQPGNEALMEGRVVYSGSGGSGLTISGIAVAVPRLYEPGRAADGRFVLTAPGQPDIVEGDCITTSGGSRGDGRFHIQSTIQPRSPSDCPSYG